MTCGGQGDAADTPPPLVLLPGTLCDATLFEPVVAHLPPARAVIVGDITGADTAEALATMVLRTAPDRFAIAGFSLGGIVAIEIAARAPQRVAGLALISATARPVPALYQTSRRAQAAAAISAASYIAEGWQAQVASARHDSADLRDALLGMAARGGLSTLLCQTEVALTRPDNRPRLSTLAMPALVVAGREDAINPPEVQEEMAALLPNVRLELVTGAGHFLPLEAPRATAVALAGWLARVDARHWAEASADATLSPPRHVTPSRR